MSAVGVRFLDVRVYQGLLYGKEPQHPAQAAVYHHCRKLALKGARTALFMYLESTATVITEEATKK